MVHKIILGRGREMPGFLPPHHSLTLLAVASLFLLLGQRPPPAGGGGASDARPVVVGPRRRRRTDAFDGRRRRGGRGRTECILAVGTRKPPSVYARRPPAPPPSADRLWDAGTGIPPDCGTLRDLESALHYSLRGIPFLSCLVISPSSFVCRTHSVSVKEMGREGGTNW